MTTTGTRPAWTLTEAVERTGASRSTLRRYRDAGKFPNAYKDSSGVWRFPLPDLLAVGLRPVDPAQSEQVDMPTEHVHPPPEQATDNYLDNTVQAELEAARKTIEKVRAELAEARQRAAVAEAVATERERMIQTQAMALRMLGPGSADQPEHVEQPAKTAMNMATDHGLSMPTEHTEQPAPSIGARPHESSPAPLWRKLFRR